MAAKDPAVRACSPPREKKEPHQICVILNCRPSRPLHLYHDIFGACGKGRPGHFDLPAAERKLVLSAALNTKILLSMRDGSGLKRASCFPDSPCRFCIAGLEPCGRVYLPHKQFGILETTRVEMSGGPVSCRRPTINRTRVWPGCNLGLLAGPRRPGSGATSIYTVCTFTGCVEHTCVEPANQVLGNAPVRA